MKKNCKTLGSNSWLKGGRLRKKKFLVVTNTEHLCTGHMTDCHTVVFGKIRKFK